MTTIDKTSFGKIVVVAKLLTGYLKIDSKIEDADAYIKVNGVFDEDFLQFVLTWQKIHDLVADGIIGPKTWATIAKTVPTCSTSKNRTSGYTFALQTILNTSIATDAIYGPRTKAATAAYQTAKGLGVDGICGPKTWSALINGYSAETLVPEKPQTTVSGEFIQPTDFKQAAKPWGPKMYSNHNDPKQTMANSGCGPTAAADIINFCNDSSVDPYDLAMLAVSWGDRSYNSGTNWTFFTHLQTLYDYKTMIATKSVETLKACLDAGGYAVASMGPGYWTSGGHYITPWKYTESYAYCNDPASSSRTRQNWKDFESQRKQFFCFFPNPKPEEPEKKSEEKQPDETPVKRGDKIVDVARYQGVINWDKLAPELAFVVIKATGWYKNGADTQYANNVKGAVSHGVPWHVYTYLYCKDDEEVKRDARLFFDVVKKEGHWPLFWVLDMEAGWGAPDKDVPKLAKAFEEELRRLCREEGPGEIRVAAYVAQQKYKDWALDYDHYEYLWIPGYGESVKPKMPCDIWQYTSHGTIAGIDGDVDLNVLMGRKPMNFFTGEDK